MPVRIPANQLFGHYIEMQAKTGGMKTEKKETAFQAKLITSSDNFAVFPYVPC